MIRKLLLFVAVLLGCLASPAYGLGLGELELNSALNQRFSAEIKLTNVRGLEVEEILPNLGSQEDFDRVGVERNYLLTDLRFKVAPNENGEMIIFVTSSKPVIEPFLNFIVEVLWPTGRILREYTVLLDPPVFADKAIESVQPSQVTNRVAQPNAVVPVPAIQPAVPSVRQPQSQPATSSRSERTGDVLGAEYGMTGQGDTLWKIALRVRPNGSVSVQQTMLALQRANPEAFINNNINLLKAGYVLRIPDVREIRAETVASAVQEVRSQNQEFDDYKDGSLVQLDATRRQPGPSDADSGRANGELKLLASNERAGERSGTGGSEAVQEIENELAVAEEDLDRARRANSEMNVKVDDLQGQLDTLNEILTLKDDQLAALKAEVQKMQAASSQPAAAQPAPTAQSGSLLDNPLVLAILGLLLVLVVAGGMILMRRRQQDKADDDEFEDAFEESAVEAEEEVVADLEEAPAIEEEEEDLSPETSDVIGEVEIYIAYGRFPQAITFLQNAIQAEPDRADIQLKLLEVYVQTEDGVAFNLQLEQLRLLNDSAAVAAALELQKKIPGAAEDAAAAMDATIISMAPVEAISESLDDDDDLSFDLDDLDSETEEDDLALGTELDLDDDGEILDLSLEADDDLELDFELEDENATVQRKKPEVETSIDDGEIELDLEDELDLDLDLEDELDLDLDDELDLDLDDDEIGLDLDDDEITLDLEDDDEIKLDLDDDDEIKLDLDDDDEIKLDLDDDDEIKLDLDDDDEITLDLEDDDEIKLDLEDDDEITLDLEDDGEIKLDLEDDDEITLDLDDDDDDILDLSGISDEDDLDLEKDLETAAQGLGKAVSDDEDEIILDLDLDDDDLDLGDDEEISLDLDGDGEISLDLEDDEFSLDLDDEDALDFDLDDEDDNKLDLARAYIDMGDSDGAKSLLQEVLKDGSDQEKQEATQLLEKFD
jgi:pilus assembly protein FimV